MNENLSEKKWLKWLYVVLCCFGSFSSYIGFYFPSVLANQIISELGLSYMQFNLLYGIQSFPNIIIPLFGGEIITRFGAATTMFVLALLKLIGSCLWVLAIKQNSFVIFALGRLVFGSTIDTLWTATNVIIAQYFGPSQQQGLALTIIYMNQGFGQFMASIFLPYLYNLQNSLYLPMVALAISSASGFLAAIGVIYLYKKYDLTSTNQSNLAQNTFKNEDFNYNGTFLEALKETPAIFYKVALLCTIGYMVFHGILINMQGLLQNVYQSKPEQGSALFGINFLSFSLIIPIIGYFQDLTGKRALYTLAGFGLWLGNLFLMLAGAPYGECIFTLEDNNFCFRSIYFPMIIFGVSQGIFEGGIWLAAQIIVKQKLLGICSGIISSAYNLGIVLISLLAGAFLDAQGPDQGYQTLIWTEIVLTVFGFAYTLHMHFDDLNGDRILYDRIVRHYQLVPGDEGNTKQIENENFIDRAEIKKDQKPIEAGSH